MIETCDRIDNGSDIMDDWTRRGLDCELRTAFPGQVVDDEICTDDRLVMVCEGSLVIDLEGDPIQPGAGQEVYVPAGTLHSFHAIGHAPVRWMIGKGQIE